jgi:hypothetical protein
MRTGLIWIGRVFLIAGVLFIAANVVMHFLGLSASYNIGDPTKYQFYLISFWHIGVALAIIGAASVYAGRRM